MLKLECPFCRLGAEPPAMTCSKCAEPLDVVSAGKLPPDWKQRPAGVWKYRELLPELKSEPVTLREGNTPLYNCGSFFVKFEGGNPTGSFKDRGMTAAVSVSRDRGVRLVLCASTGNTSASLAAYAARAKIRCAVLVPEGKIAAGKMAQAVAYGARVVQVEGNFDQALAALRDAQEGQEGIELLNSINPARIEGQKTLAFEVCDELGVAPDHLVLPVGNAGNIRAIWKGFKEYLRLGIIKKLPRMIAAQAEGSAWLLKGKMSNPQTIATAIRIGNPVSGTYARAAIKESGGEIAVVTDEEILAAQKRLAREFGVFVEPASAVPIAALPKLKLSGLVVCVATGHGLKDPDIVVKEMSVVRVKPNKTDILNALEQTSLV